MPLGKFTSAECLVIHIPFLYQGVSAFLKATSTPVLVPPKNAGCIDSFAGPTAGSIDLPQIFPTGRCQGSGQDGIAVGSGVSGGAKETELEALQTTRAALRHVGDADGRLSGRRQLFFSLSGRFGKLSDRRDRHNDRCRPLTGQRRLQPTDK